MKTRNLILCGSLPLTAILVAACVSVQDTYLPGGEAAYSISCNALGTNWSTCLVEAGSLCKQNGYRVAYENRIDGELLIRCKPAAGEAVGDPKIDRKPRHRPRIRP